MRSYSALSSSPTSSESISNKIFELVKSQCIPLETTIELTQDCNFQCTHCYNFDRTSITAKKKHLEGAIPLSSEEIMALIYELELAGCLNITFTGGEALLHRNFFDFVDLVRQKHMGVFVKTNGSLLNVSMVKKLKTSRVLGLEISLYGMESHTHDALTQTPGSLTKILKGIDLCIAEKIKVKLNYILTNHNVSEVQTFLDYVQDRNLEYGINPQITSRYDGTNSSLEVRVSETQLTDLYRSTLKDHLPIPDFDPKASVQCGCAVGICAIGFEGTVYPCIGAPVPAGNIRETPFIQIWKNSEVFKTIRNLKLSDFKSCEPCEDRPFCRRSSGLVYANTKNYTGPEEWTCMEAKVIHQCWKENEHARP
jgi:AdoMet-dependent heme synthase